MIDIEPIIGILFGWMTATAAASLLNRKFDNSIILCLILLIVIFIHRA